jgi:hypothetical protein
MGFRTGKHSSSLLTFLDAAVTIWARLDADPRTKALAGAWWTWIGDTKTAVVQEMDLRIALVAANAVATHLDEDLDGLSHETWDATEENEAERLFFYQGLTNRQFTAPKLGIEWKKMGPWITHMAGSKDPKLVDIGVRLAAVHPVAGTAMQTAEDADVALREFRTTGAKKALVDRYNALGKGTEGDLKEMPHAHPELRLPGDFYERFMRTSRPVVPPTIVELAKRRDDAKESLDQAQADLDAAVKAEKDAADEAARVVRDADQKRLAALLAEQNKRAEEIAALQAKVGATPPPPPQG